LQFYFGREARDCKAIEKQSKFIRAIKK